MAKAPWEWCTPRNAFGQLTEPDNTTPVSTRVWNPPPPGDPEELTQFRAAVWQHVICLWVRTHKNATPNPSAPTRSTPLQYLVDEDPRYVDFDYWQGRMTGRYRMNTRDIVTLMAVFPGALPTESDVADFMDVASKRTPPPPAWGWPDT